MNKLVKTAVTAAGTLGVILAPAIAFAAAGQVPDTIKQAGDVDLTVILANIIGYVLSFAGGIAVLYLIWAGIQYITGGAKGAETAKTSIVNAIIGVVVIILSYTIVQVVIKNVK